ncbi:MAG TPA: hypothetical protein VK614_09330 [Allosphingosinicella sp.]|nr:hypothetical protein [Allosphingosinicella sp.]
MAGKFLGLIVLAIALTTAAAFAADPPPPSGEQRLICRSGQRSLGSHIRAQRRCRTAEQWQREEEANANLPVTLQVTQGQNDGRVTPAPQ